MANPAVVPATMLLYSHFEPTGRKFLQGEPWPGDAWSDKPGGRQIGESSATAILQELMEAQDQIENLGQVIQSKDHDLAQLGKQRDEAVRALEDQKQALLDAEKAQAEAEAVVAEFSKERDAAIVRAEQAEAALAAAQKGAKAKESA